jgi:hypothetical protein
MGESVVLSYDAASHTTTAFIVGTPPPGYPTTAASAAVEDVADPLRTPFLIHIPYNDSATFDGHLIGARTGWGPPGPDVAVEAEPEPEPPARRPRRTA